MTTGNKDAGFNSGYVSLITKNSRVCCYFKELNAIKASQESPGSSNPAAILTLLNRMWRGDYHSDTESKNQDQGPPTTRGLTQVI